MNIYKIKEQYPNWIYIKTFTKNNKTFIHFKNPLKTANCTCKGLDCDGCELSSYEEIEITE